MKTNGLTTMSGAARRLGEPTSFVRGVVAGLGLDLERVGKSRVLRPSQYKRVETAARLYKRPAAKAPST